MMLMYDTICKVYPYHRDGGSYKYMIIYLPFISWWFFPAIYSAFGDGGSYCFTNITIIHGYWWRFIPTNWSQL
jgi:hypothetical protein